MASAAPGKAANLKNMYIPLTTAALALLTVAMILLRIFWDRVPPRLRFVLIRMSIALGLAPGFLCRHEMGNHIGPLNAVISWLAVASYELLILLFSRLSPRWLTSISAAILLIPLFAASILFPLTELFNPYPNKKVSINRHFFYEVKPWGNFGPETIVTASISLSATVPHSRLFFVKKFNPFHSIIASVMPWPLLP